MGKGLIREPEQRVHLTSYATKLRVTNNVCTAQQQFDFPTFGTKGARVHHITLHFSLCLSLTHTLHQQAHLMIFIVHALRCESLVEFELHIIPLA
jgi:hypothetical protein